MTYHLRPFNPETDYPRLVELANMFDPVETTVELMREEHATRQPGSILREIVAVDDSGLVVAYGNAECAAYLIPEKRFWIGILVDIAHQRQGIGSRLYDDLYAFATEQGALRLESFFKEDAPESMTFAQKRGFVLKRHIFDSILDLTGFDETPYAGLIEQVKASGIHFLTYADAGDSEANRRKLYDLDLRVTRDIPGYDWPDEPFDKWVKDYIEFSLFVAESQFIAADGEQWIGFASVGYAKENDIYFNWMTGVESAYRGRKIALALKLLTIEYVRARQGTKMRTNNDSLNGPMLAINRKLGYKPVPGWYRMNKQPA